MGSFCSSPERSRPTSPSSSPYAPSPKDDGDMTKLPLVHTEPIHSLCAADSDNIITTIADKSTVIVYDWINHSLKQTFLLPEGSRPTQVVCNGSSNWVHVGSRCGSIHSWKWSADSNNGNRAKNEPLKTLTGHKLSVTSLACTFDQPQMLVSGSRDNFMKLWDMTIGKCIGSCEISRNLSTGMKWIKNEWSVVQSSEDKTLRVWDVRTCTVVQWSQARRHILLCCDASSSNGNHLLSGSSGDDNNGGDLILWDRRNLTKGPIIEYNGHTNNINGCLFMTESTQPMLCSCSTDNTVRLWDYASNECLLTHHVSGAGPISGLAVLTPILLAGSTFNDGVHIWKITKIDNRVCLDLRAKY